MPASFPVPIQEDIRDLLMNLLGKGAAVDKTDALDFEEDEPGIVATYITEDESVGVLCLCDVPFAVFVGAALVMVPANVAKEQLTAAEIDEQYMEFVHEVLNILARLVNTPRTPHVRLGEVYKLPAELPENVISLRAKPEYRRDFVATIEGYGEGRISILVN